MRITINSFQEYIKNFPCPRYESNGIFLTQFSGPALQSTNCMQSEDCELFH